VGAHKSRWLYDADVENVVALEGLAAAVADDPAHHLRGQLARKPHSGSGAAGVVLATNEPNRFPGQGLGEPAVVSFLHVFSIGWAPGRLEPRRKGDLNAGGEGFERGQRSPALTQSRAWR
jgi:hypothetical protein